MTSVRGFLWLPLLAGAQPAFAHSPVPGIEGFYIGLVHPFSTPAQVLLILGLGLLIGSFPIHRARWLLLAFFGTSLLALMIGLRMSDLDAIMFAVAFGSCAFVALLPGHLMPVALAGACLGGLLIGDASVPDDGPVRDRLFTMSGSFVGANLGLLYLFGARLWISERFTWPWVRIGFRVLAAWLGAISLLMLALETTN